MVYLKTFQSLCKLKKRYKVYNKLSEGKALASALCLYYNISLGMPSSTVACHLFSAYNQESRSSVCRIANTQSPVESQ